MENRTVIQWDKDDIDIVGFVKVDVLSLGMLTAIRKCFDLVETHDARTLSLSSIDDADTYDMICKADTIGVFQIESRAQMSMLPRMKPRCFYDLVIQVSIVRPGPIQGAWCIHISAGAVAKNRSPMHTPIWSPSCLAHWVFPSFKSKSWPWLWPSGNFTPGQADALRRAMGAWKKGTLGPLAEQLTHGMKKMASTHNMPNKSVKQIQGFGEYGFPESHAASFSRLVYVSAWLKHHYPAAFCVALLNSQPMGFYSARSLIDDARRHGVSVDTVDIQHSDWDNKLEVNEDGIWRIRFGSPANPRA